jgi:hypothetical protein
MSNLLKLHEAIAVVLLSKPKRTATFDVIAKEINKRKLYIRSSDGGALPPYQVMMRTKLSKGKYSHLFTFYKPDLIKLI